jgi:hypothetical protein
MTGAIVVPGNRGGTCPELDLYSRLTDGERVTNSYALRRIFAAPMSSNE